MVTLSKSAPSPDKDLQYAGLKLRDQPTKIKNETFLGWARFCSSITQSSSRTVFTK